MNFLEEFKNILTEVFLNESCYSTQRINFITYWKDNLKDFINFFYRLDDDESKEIFLKLLRYNLCIAWCGNSAHSKYALYSPDEWKNLEKKAKCINFIDNDYILDRIETFVLEGYSYKNVCCAKEGYNILDCGAYTGNTSVYFSDKVGKKGKVFAFEAMPETYDKLNKNMMKLNKSNIETYNFAISNEIKKIKFTATAGAGSREIFTSNGIEIQAISIDEFVTEKKLNHVDYIKMDIEGSELNALNGAIHTCKTYHPILAICIYHKIEDWIEIPKKILEIDPNYKFYLKHNSNCFFETVLFAINLKKEVAVNYNEIEDVRYLWNLYQKIYQNKQRESRKLLLLAYVSKLTTISDVKLKYKIDMNDFMHVYFPISDDEKLYFAFIFHWDTIRICLKFEGKWVKNSSIISQIINLSQMNTELLDRSSKKEGLLTFITDKMYEIDYISSLMNYLIDISWPVLRQNKLISDKILLNIS